MPAASKICTTRAERADELRAEKCAGKNLVSGYTDRYRCADDEHAEGCALQHSLSRTRSLLIHGATPEVDAIFGLMLKYRGNTLGCVVIRHENVQVAEHGRVW